MMSDEQCVYVLDEFEESSDMTTRRLLGNLQHVWTPDVALVSDNHTTFCSGDQPGSYHLHY